MNIVAISMFVIGLCIGSFINAFQYRAEPGKSLKGRSYCPRCKHQLAWYDLTPVLSWIFLGGKCRYCHKPISVQYPIVEILTGVVVVLFVSTTNLDQTMTDLLLGEKTFSAFELLNLSIAVVSLLFVVGSLVLIALHDYKTKYVLSSVVYWTIAASCIFHATQYNGQLAFWSLINYFLPFFLAAAISGVGFFVIYFFSRGKWMGAGDIELAVLMGILLGWPKTIVAFYVAFVVGALVGGYLLINKQAKMKTEIPFGPFLILGTTIAFFYGKQLLEIYDKIFIGW